MQLDRRQFFGALAASAVAVAAPWRSVAAATTTATHRALRFAHLHTGERLSVEYFTGGYLSDALSAVNHFLRDFRTGDTHVIDPGLLDVLFELQQRVGSSRPFEVISGYRSPVTNAMLRRKSEGVASASLHMRGQAIDIRLADVPLSRLRGMAMAMQSGGVGYYPASNFVHLDTGRVRSW